ncbi:homocysteine S-methyltransferase family protein [Tateyamaria armeniaca]|uniref:Homocysteine S-methyltransferase family protein n=1 Tax=Tateyamaria armeniaca TaxID=2518930 RepID=A0ABW8URX5_9RHOB
MADITLLDGGMGQELVRRSGDTPTAMWSTRVMQDHPGLVQAIHADFFAAGATVATANTYALHHDRIEGSDLEGHLPDLYGKALAEAEAARDSHGSGRIAGAIGPLRASYRPDLHPDPETAVAIFSEVTQLLAQGCDLVICETVASLAHARDVLAAAVTSGKPVWLAMTVKDTDGTHLRSGELVADVLPIAEEKAAALLINCAAPEAITTAIHEIKSTTLPFGAYANGFEQIAPGFLKDKPTVDALRTRRDFTPAAYADHVMGWVDAGATIVGGCCEVGPAHIAEIATRLRAAGHIIV